MTSRRPLPRWLRAPSDPYRAALAFWADEIGARVARYATITFPEPATLAIRDHLKSLEESARG